MRSQEQDIPEPTYTGLDGGDDGTCQTYLWSVLSKRYYDLYGGIGTVILPDPVSGINYQLQTENMFAIMESQER